MDGWGRNARRVLLGLLVCVLASCGKSSDSTNVAPAITTQPASTSAVAGTNAAFTVVATGDGPLTYQWQQSTDGGATFGAISGATAATLLVGAVTSLDQSQYRVVIVGPGGTVTSSAATLTVTAAPTPPAITAQPADVTVAAGLDATFSFTASGTSLAYQWQSSTDGVTWTNLAGANGVTFVVHAVGLSNNGTLFRGVASNSSGVATTRAALLTVTAVPAQPAIAAEPSATTVVAPSSGTFRVVATGYPTPTYQWQESTDGGVTFADIAGATGATFTTPPTTTGDNGERFRVVVTNSIGSVASADAVLTVAATAVAPAITLQPISQTVTAPATATFVVAANGAPSPSYQWQSSKDSGATFANINGATAATLTTAPTAKTDSGEQFRVVVTNSAGSVTSTAAVLTIN